ncbi:MAG: Cobalt-zinc-cadmium resistance protein CzcB [Parcubacteria group bacterium ADurb.Bin247]|jgi:RND family efflux transporter MFP subunit|nr:MAG: Cobalt-zinc-cadmium resistance protein CzcB [Parcubacteria group bacterium ADurb.Bin247]HQB85287.1 efflux RND transporter periplasmic adaptor subunit [Candidatus Pacearchaeota archaeon]
MKKSIIYILIILIIAFALINISEKEYNPLLEENNLPVVSLVDVSSLTNQSVEIPVNGKIESEREAMLSVEAGGQVKDIFVSVGDIVSAGEVLLTIDDSDQKLRVDQAKAVLDAQNSRLNEMLNGSLDDLLAIKESVVSSAEIALERITVQSENSVIDAKKALLNNDLRAYLSRDIADNNYNTQPPTITGTYSGEEGEYLITLYASGTQSGYSFRYTGPEGSGSGSVSTRSPQPLGENGLYILFPDNFTRLPNVEWLVPIPNNRSATYITYLNAYQNALREKDYSIRQATEALNQAKKDLELAKAGSREEQIEAQRAQVKQAEINLSLAKSQLSKYQLKAPFDGSISSISVKKGESIGIGQAPIKIINSQSLKLTTFVSPERSRTISSGNDAIIDGIYEGKVGKVSNTINPENGQVELNIYFSGGDFMPGEYVSAKIFGVVNDNRISVPLQSIKINNLGSFVYTVVDDLVVAIPVVLGASENDKVLVVSGLDGVEKILSNTSIVEEGDKVIVK